MAFNGEGTFRRVHNWLEDRAASIKGTASRMDEEDDGIATGLSTVICKDGQTTATDVIHFAHGLKPIKSLSGDAPSIFITGDADTGIAAPAQLLTLVADTTGVFTASPSGVSVETTLTITGDLIRSHDSGQSCRVANTGTTSLRGGPTRSPVKLNFASETYDTGGMHDDTNNSRITITQAGVYLITGGLDWTTTVANSDAISWSIQIKLNGTTVIAKNGANYSYPNPDRTLADSCTVAAIHSATVGDYLELEFNSSFTNQISSSNWSANFSAALLSAA